MMPGMQMPGMQMPGMQSPMMPNMGDQMMTAPNMPYMGGQMMPSQNMPNQMPQGPSPQPMQSMTPPNQAQIVVTLPADARMYVDGIDMNLTGSVRQFRTPDLKPGTKNTYSIKIVVDRGGKPVEETKTVDLVPGQTTRVHFAEPGSPGSNVG